MKLVLLVLVIAGILRLASQGRRLSFRGGSLAQLVEQRTLNPFVAGSSPAGCRP